MKERLGLDSNNAGTETEQPPSDGLAQLAAQSLAVAGSQHATNKKRKAGDHEEEETEQEASASEHDSAEGPRKRARTEPESAPGAQHMIRVELPAQKPPPAPQAQQGPSSSASTVARPTVNMPKRRGRPRKDDQRNLNPVVASKKKLVARKPQRNVNTETGRSTDSERYELRPQPPCDYTITKHKPSQPAPQPAPGSRPRGRPPGKKRGRKPKNDVPPATDAGTDSVPPPKKRGRKPKQKVPPALKSALNIVL